MSAKLTVAEILVSLEAQMAHHRERETHHAREESLHREQREAHAAEYAAVAQNYEAFKASAGTASEMAARAASLAPSLPPPPQEPLAKLPLRTHLVAGLVAQLPAGQVFNPSNIAAELNRRYGNRLKKPVGSRLASTALRRLCQAGVIRLVRKGTAHHEALYTTSPSVPLPVGEG